MSKPFGNPLWDQMKKVRIDRDGTFRAPVKADGKDGIVIGDPPLGVPPKEARRGLIGRLLARLRS
jgi:hypothetical protein